MTRVWCTRPGWVTVEGVGSRRDGTCHSGQQRRNLPRATSRGPKPRLRFSSEEKGWDSDRTEEWGTGTFLPHLWKGGEVETGSLNVCEKEFSEETPEETDVNGWRKSKPVGVDSSRRKTTPNDTGSL